MSDVMSAFWFMSLSHDADTERSYAIWWLGYLDRCFKFFWK